MSTTDRFFVAMAVLAAATASGDGVARTAEWAGAGKGVQALAFFATAALVLPMYVGAIRAYGRHGWRGER